MFDVFARSPFYRKEERELGTIYRTVVRSPSFPRRREPMLTTRSPSY